MWIYVGKKKNSHILYLMIFKFIVNTIFWQTHNDTYVQNNNINQYTNILRHVTYIFTVKCKLRFLKYSPIPVKLNIFVLKKCSQ